MKFQDFICGLFAGWSQVIVGQPFDYIKVRLQIESQSSKKNLISVAKQIKKQHGLIGFYRGASSLYFGYSFTVALQFTIYEFSKRLIHNFKTRKLNEQVAYKDEAMTIFQVGMAGGIVGSFSSFIHSPVQYAKIKMQMNPNMSKGSLWLLLSQIKMHGIKNIGKGFSATLLRQIPGQGSYFASYEYLVRTLTKQKRSEAGTFTFLVSGGAAGLISWIVSYPFDVIKTKVQHGESYQEALKNIHLTGFNGFSAVFIRSILANAAGFVAYQHSKKMFQWLKQKQYYH